LQSSETKFTSHGLCFTLSEVPVGFRLLLAAAWRAGKSSLSPERALDDFWGERPPRDERAAWLAVDAILGPV
jgi:hypothetical protein